MDLPGKIEQVSVLVDGQISGLLSKTAHYSYQPMAGSSPVSLTMQRDDLSPYVNGALHPVFAQNLPEGQNRKYIADRLARYARLDDVYLLALQGNTGIGMLGYDSGYKFPDPENISMNDILTYQGDTPLFPQLLEKYYLRNMVSGMQPKVLLSINDFGRTLQQKDVIVKTFDADYPQLTVNEYVCMQAAKYCGINVPETYLSENQETFVVERFDKVDGVHFGYEDFTTLMKKANSPDAKYTGSYETLLKAVDLYTKKPCEVKKAYSYIVFSCLIGNGDAHLKNFALQYSPDMSDVFLSPMFDVTHTQIYAYQHQIIDDQMALKLAKSKQFPDLKRLVGLGISAGLTAKECKDLIELYATMIKEYLAQSVEVLLMDGLKESIISSVDSVLVAHYNTKDYMHDRRLKHK